MEKSSIIREIQRTAKANGSVALGWRRFRSETGIRYHDWCGRYWTKWGDAVREAGFVPNRLPEAYKEEFLIEKLVLLTRKLGRVPTIVDILLETKQDSEFPSEKVFRRLGSKYNRRGYIIAYCDKKDGFNDVSDLWKQVTQSTTKDENAEEINSAVTIGYVYILRHGNRMEFKIGRTNNKLRREGEIGVELPGKVKPIHVIETDDPPGGGLLASSICG
jgi:hypothetical protein